MARINPKQFSHGLVGSAASSAQIITHLLFVEADAFGKVAERAAPYPDFCFNLLRMEGD